MTKSDAPGKYVVHPYTGDFAKVLDAIVGEQGWPLEPLQTAMRLAKRHGWLVDRTKIQTVGAASDFRLRKEN